MGCAMPYALAAKINHPDRPVIALVGDGAMQMNGINSLITIARMWPGWKDPRLVVMVTHNSDAAAATDRVITLQDGRLGSDEMSVVGG